MIELYKQRLSPKRMWSWLGVIGTLITIFGILEFSGFAMNRKNLLLLFLGLLITYLITIEINVYSIFKDFIRKDTEEDIETMQNATSEPHILLDEISSYLNARENKELYYRWHEYCSVEKLYRKTEFEIEQLFKNFCNQRNKSILQKKFFDDRKERNESN